MERYDEKDNWNVDLDSLKKSLKAVKEKGKIKKTKYILITNPNNPTGTVLNRSSLEDIVDIANEYKLLRKKNCIFILASLKMPKI